MPLSFLHSAKSLILLVGILLTISCLVPQLARADSFDIYGYPIEDFTTDQTLDVAATYDSTGAGGTGSTGETTGATPAQETPPPCITEYCNDSWFQILHKVVVGSFGWLVGGIGYFFDYAIKEFIIGFGENYKTSHLGFTINALWGTVRDIFNLSFIFGLIYIGFKMILDSSDSSARKMLVSLLGAALLVNFSLFITKFVVDFSNIAAFKIYEAFVNLDGEVASISVAFANMLGMSSVFSVNPLTSQGGSLTYLFGMLIVLLILAYVYLAGAILITVRFVILNIYMVFSPIMFLGWVFPSMAGHSKKYWNGFLGQAFFAPAFLFMLYLSYRIVGTYNDSVTKSFAEGMYFEQARVGQADSLIPFFAMTIVFLMASMVVAKKMGGQGAAFGIGIADKARKSAQGIIVGGAAKGMQNKLDKWSANDGSPEANRFGRRALRTVARGAVVAGARDFTDATYNKSTLGVMRKNAKAREQGLSSRDATARNQTAITAGLASQEALLSGGAALTPAQRAAHEANVQRMQTVATGMSNSQIEDMTAAQRTALSSSFNNKQVENVMKSDKISETDKAAISAARVAAITRVAGETGRIVTEEFTKLTVDQLETMGADYVRDNAHLLTNTQVDDLKKSNNFNAAQRDSFTTARKDTHANAFTPTAPVGSIEAIFYHQNGDPTKPPKLRKPSDIANLGRDTLLQLQSIPFLTPDVLEIIADKKTLGTNDRAQLRSMILGGPNTPSYTALKGWLRSPEGLEAWKVSN